MSFKSRQRAKHSHLFGDDPLSASSPATDDPLFGAGKRSPKPTDPLRNKDTGSIFGDIDVSKLGGGSLFSSKRSALRNGHQDDEDALFGGGTHRRRQQQQTATTSSSSSARSSLSDSASFRSETAKSSPSSPRKAPPPPVPERPIPAAATVRPQQPMPDRKPPPPPVPQRPASAATRKPVPPPVPERPSSAATSPQPPPSTTPEQPSSASLAPPNSHLHNNNSSNPSSLFSRFLNNNKKPQIQPSASPASDTSGEQQQQQQQQRAHDPYYDDPELLASVANDALRFDTTPTMNPSISTPQSDSNPWSVLDPIRTTSSPLIKTQQQQPPTVMNIEPSKRTAFADLIDSWHNDKRRPVEPTPPGDDEQFFTRVAAEQRDIGFAGIDSALDGKDGDDQEPQQPQHHHVRSSNRLWDIEETDNPWR